MSNDLQYYCDYNRHLVCYPFSKSNLHKMAKDLNIKRCWYHSGDNPHYDIPVKRNDEIMMKCLVVTTRDIWRIINDDYNPRAVC